MLQSFRRSFLLLVGVFLFAAAPVLAQVGPDSVRRAAWQQFQAESGSQWKVRWGERAGIPRSIYGGATRSFSGSPETAARSFLAQYRDLFKMKPDLRGLELKSVNTLRGIHHVRFQQTYEDIPVYEAEYLVHVREDGRVDMANGHYYPDIDVSTQPRIDPSSAERIAIQKIEGTPIREEITIEQVIYPVQESFSLAWKITVPLEPFGGWVYFVDAMSGTVLDAQNQLVDATGTKTVSEEHSPSSFPGTGLFREGRRSSMSVSGTGTVYPTHPGLSSPTNVGWGCGEYGRFAR